MLLNIEILNEGSCQNKANRPAESGRPEHCRGIQYERFLRNKANSC